MSLSYVSLSFNDDNQVCYLISPYVLLQDNVRSWKAHENTLDQDVSQLRSCIS